MVCCNKIKMSRFVLIAFVFPFHFCGGERVFKPLVNLKPFRSDAEQTAAVQSLLGRIVPYHVDQIEVSVDSSLGTDVADVVKVRQRIYKMPIFT